MKISEKKVVQIHYTLKNDSGEILDSSEGRDPLVYMHGKGNIIPGLENALNEKESGEKISVVIPPEEAYGVRNEGLVQQVALSRFQDPENIRTGVQVQVSTNDGSSIARVTKIENEEVTLDLNHPLADETLHFEVEVMGVREATQEELSHGHVHGPGGHHH